MPGVSVSSPALGNTISAEWEIAFLQNRKVRRPASCKIVLAGFSRCTPGGNLTDLYLHSHVCKLQSWMHWSPSALLEYRSPFTRYINILQYGRHKTSKHLCWQVLNKMNILLFAHGSQFKKEGLHGCITAQHCKANRYHTNSGQNHHNTCQIRRMASAMQSQPLRGESSWQTLSRLCKLSFWVHKIKTIALSQL